MSVLFMYIFILLIIKVDGLLPKIHLTKKANFNIVFFSKKNKIKKNNIKREKTEKSLLKGLSAE